MDILSNSYILAFGGLVFAAGCFAILLVIGAGAANRAAEMSFASEFREGFTVIDGSADSSLAAAAQDVEAQDLRRAA